MKCMKKNPVKTRNVVNGSHRQFCVWMLHNRCVVISRYLHLTKGCWNRLALRTINIILININWMTTFANREHKDNQTALLAAYVCHLVSFGYVSWYLETRQCRQEVWRTTVDSTSQARIEILEIVTRLLDRKGHIRNCMHAAISPCTVFRRPTAANNYATRRILMSQNDTNGPGLLLPQLRSTSAHCLLNCKALVYCVW